MNGFTRNFSGAVFLSVAIVIATSSGLALPAHNSGHTTSQNGTTESAMAYHSDSFTTQDYNITFHNVTIKTWLLRNVTVTDVKVRQLTVRTVHDGNGSRIDENVTLHNVSVERLFVENATLFNVSADTLMIRNKSVLNVPGGEFIDPKIANRTIQKHTLKNVTIDGLIITQLIVRRSVLKNATLKNNVPIASAEQTDPSDEPRPSSVDIRLVNATIGNAVLVNGAALNVSAENASALTNRTTNSPVVAHQC